MWPTAARSAAKRSCGRYRACGELVCSLLVSPMPVCVYAALSSSTHGTSRSVPPVAAIRATSRRTRSAASAGSISTRPPDQISHKCWHGAPGRSRCARCLAVGMSARCSRSRLQSGRTVRLFNERDGNGRTLPTRDTMPRQYQLDVTERPIFVAAARRFLLVQRRR
jgi:hypothetical protein